MPTRWSIPSISRILTVTRAKGRAAEWGAEAAVTLDLEAAVTLGLAGGGGRGGRGGGQRRTEEPRTDGKKILERISKETGGRFFEVSKKESVGDIYTSIAEELRTQYSMGYTPDKDSAATGYHHVQLAVKKKELTVQTRDGYYADR